MQAEPLVEPVGLVEPLRPVEPLVLLLTLLLENLVLVLPLPLDSHFLQSMVLAL